MPPFLYALACLVFIAIPAAAAPCPDWPTDRARAEIAALQQQIDTWDDSYHRLGQSLVADEPDDQSHTQLVQWPKCFNLAPPDEPRLQEGGKGLPPVIQTSLGKHK